MSDYTAHVDSFARDRMPPVALRPWINREPPQFAYPKILNCAVELLDRTSNPGHADRPALHSLRQTWSYRHLQEQVNRIAHVLTDDLGLVPGNRVLLRSFNNPMAVACWLAVAKAGGIVVATMPLLRAGELETIVNKTEAKLALCDQRLATALQACRGRTPSLEQTCLFDGQELHAELEDLMGEKQSSFEPCATGRDDIVVIVFTSGTTGEPKGAMHSHSDIMAITEAFPRAVLKPTPDDIFIGSPPLAFSYGLGSLMAFPLKFGASAVLLESATPDNLIEAIARFKATICCTVPTGYRAILQKLDPASAKRPALPSLRLCASAGEALPLATFEAWQHLTGLPIVDGIGTTEMLNHFISSPVDAIRPGATGKPLPGYQARIVDDAMNTLPAGEVGRLAVRGPTGCCYLDDPRQADYVVNGWNLTGDAFHQDEDGYFWYAARSDDMIVSSGYNIAGPEVEDALLHHPAVAECAVVAAPDKARGAVAKAYIVLSDGRAGDDGLARELQEFVKGRIAPYKYPRAVTFLSELPKTQTGKVQRHRLRALAADTT